MSRSIFAAALAVALASPSLATGPRQPTGMAHAMLEPPTGAPVELLFPAVPGLRYEYLDGQTGHRLKATQQVAQVAPGEVLQILAGDHPTLGRVSVRTRRFASGAFRLERVTTRSFDLDLSDDPLALAAAPEVLPRERFEATPAQPNPVTGGRMRWRAVAREVPDGAPGTTALGAAGGLRYELRVTDLRSDVVVGEALLDLTPGLGPTRLRGHLLGACLDLRLAEVRWPWQR